MRSIIVDFARRRMTDRRGRGAVHLAVDGDLEPAAESPGEAEIVGVHQALERIAAVDPRLTQVVEMKYFAGMTEPEIAQALGITERTVRRDWQKARLLLRDALA
jgi:RNA polymerase sigma factor (TIGR02999 family)